MLKNLKNRIYSFPHRTQYIHKSEAYLDNYSGEAGGVYDTSYQKTHMFYLKTQFSVVFFLNNFQIVLNFQWGFEPITFS